MAHIQKPYTVLTKFKTCSFICNTFPLGGIWRRFLTLSKLIIYKKAISGTNYGLFKKLNQISWTLKSLISLKKNSYFLGIRPSSSGPSPRLHPASHLNKTLYGEYFEMPGKACER